MKIKLGLYTNFHGKCGLGEIHIHSFLRKTYASESTCIIYLPPYLMHVAALWLTRDN